MGGQWESGEVSPQPPNPDRWLQPSLGVGTVWSRGGSPHPEQQKGLDSGLALPVGICAAGGHIGSPGLASRSV